MTTASGLVEMGGSDTPPVTVDIDDEDDGAVTVSVDFSGNISAVNLNFSFSASGSLFEDGFGGFGPASGSLDYGSTTDQTLNGTSSFSGTVNADGSFSGYIYDSPALSEGEYEYGSPVVVFSGTGFLTSPYTTAGLGANFEDQLASGSSVGASLESGLNAIGAVEASLDNPHIGMLIHSVGNALDFSQLVSASLGASSLEAAPNFADMAAALGVTGDLVHLYEAVSYIYHNPTTNDAALSEAYGSAAGAVTDLAGTLGEIPASGASSKLIANAITAGTEIGQGDYLNAVSTIGKALTIFGFASIGTALNPEFGTDIGATYGDYASQLATKLGNQIANGVTGPVIETRTGQEVTNWYYNHFLK